MNHLPTFKSYFVKPTVTVAQQAALIYLMKSLPGLRKGLLVFVKSLVSIDLLGDVAPSVLGTLVYRILRYTEFGKRHRNSSALIAGLIFCRTTRLDMLKLIASALASCWVFEVIKTWDHWNDCDLSDEEKEKPKSEQSSPWVLAANVLFTACAGGHIYSHLPRISPWWFQSRVPLLWGFDMVEKGRFEKYRLDYMVHCSGNYHARESCVASCLARFPRCYKRSLEIGTVLQIPSLLLKRNIWKSGYKAHEFAFHMTSLLGLSGVCVCLGNAILTKPGPLKRIWRYWHGFIIAGLCTYITSRWVLRNPDKDEYFGIWFGQVTLFSIMALVGDWSYVVFGTLAINGLRRRIERSKSSKKSSKIAIGLLLESFCIGQPVRKIYQSASKTKLAEKHVNTKP